MKTKSKETFRRVALDLIDPSPFQARKTFDTADWPEFVASVRTSGVVQPGVAREVGDRIELVCGERRFRAAKECQLADMPLMIRDLTDAEAQDIVQIENLQREGLNEIEEAQGYADWIQRLTSGEPPQAKTKAEAIAHIESRIHRKRATIYERLRLTELTEPEAKLLREGKISASLASLLPTIPDPKARAKYVEEWAQRLEWEEDYAPSVRATKEEIEDKFCKPLRASEFDPEVEYDVPAGVSAKGAVTCLTQVNRLMACTACQFRTGNMLDEFPDLAKRPNVCTRPACAKVKTQIAAQLKVAEAVGKGKQTLTLKEYRARKGEFIDGHKKITAENRWGQDLEECMGKHKPEATLVPTADGIIKVYPKDEALKAMKQNGVKFYANRAGQSPEERAKAEQAKKVIEERRKKLIETHRPRIVAALRKLKDAAAWKLVAEFAKEDSSVRDGFPKPTTPQEEFLFRYFPDDPTEWNDDWDKQALARWKALGVDLVAEEKKLLAAEKEKEQAPDKFTKDLLTLAKQAGFKTIVDQFGVITNCAARHDLPDIDGCKTDKDRAALLKAFGDECEVIIKAGKKTKTKKGKKK